MSTPVDGYGYLPAPPEANLIALLFDSPDGALPCVSVTRRRTRVGDYPFTFDRDTITEVVARGMVTQDGERLRITDAGRAYQSALRERGAAAVAARQERRLARRRGRCTLCGGTWAGRTDDEARAGHAEHMKTAHNFSVKD